MFKSIQISTFLIGLAMGALAHAEPATGAELNRASLLSRESTVNGAQVNTNVIRVTLPVGYKTPLHTHEGPGPRYVLRGRIKIEEGGQSHVYGVGDAFWETGQWMTAENVGDSEVELLIIELTAPKP